MWFRRSFPALILLGASLAQPAIADAPTLHVYFERDDREDLRLGATTGDGVMPLAIDTPSGVVPAPAADHKSLVPAQVYGTAASAVGSGDSYRLDTNTSRPEAVSYEDPFNPTITPFKRLHAYDGVSPTGELEVRSRALTPLTVGGVANADDDQFYADLVVDLAPLRAIRIPSVGPGARVLAWQTFPATRLELLRDGAENWFVRGPQRERVRLTMQLAIPRAVFGSDLAATMRPTVPAPLPEPVARAADRVLARIGVTPDPGALRRNAETLIGYFRGFAASDETPTNTEPLALYEELSLARRGVCRHRAYAFVLTALRAGIPTRFVRNEAHAWVEIDDGVRWHRIDLGGAAGRVDLGSPDTGFRHVAPADPHPWPPGAESAEEMSRHAPQAPPSSVPPDGSAAANPFLAQPNNPLPPAHIVLDARDVDVRRGAPLTVAGTVDDGSGRPCPGVRVDVGLTQVGAPPIPLGSLATDAAGRFSGSVTVRLDLDLGEYQLLVATPGSPGCGATVRE